MLIRKPKFRIKYILSVNECNEIFNLKIENSKFVYTPSISEIANNIGGRS